MFRKKSKKTKNNANSTKGDTNSMSSAMKALNLNSPNNKSSTESPSSLSPTNTTATGTTPSTSINSSSNPTGDTAAYLSSLSNKDLVERVRVKIKNAHVFKLPTVRTNAQSGWRGADWKDKVWQGTVKVVERGSITAILLVDTAKDTIFAVCPMNGDGAVDRCIDSSRYFVLRIQNENGGHMFIGVAFNERSDAFDFNTALEDSKREKMAESQIGAGGAGRSGDKIFSGPAKDYSIKDGEKIKVAIPNSGSPIKKGSGSSQRIGVSGVNIPQSHSQGGGTAAFEQFHQIDSPDSKSESQEEDLKPPSSALERRRQNRITSPPRKTKKIGSSSGANKGFLLPSAKDTPKRSSQEKTSR